MSKIFRSQFESTLLISLCAVAWAAGSGCKPSTSATEQAETEPAKKMFVKREYASVDLDRSRPQYVIVANPLYSANRVQSIRDLETLIRTNFPEAWVVYAGGIAANKSEDEARAFYTIMSRFAPMSSWTLSDADPIDATGAARICAALTNQAWPLANNSYCANLFGASQRYDMEAGLLDIDMSMWARLVTMDARPLAAGGSPTITGFAAAATTNTALTTSQVYAECARAARQWFHLYYNFGVSNEPTPRGSTRALPVVMGHNPFGSRFDARGAKQFRRLMDSMVMNLVFSPNEANISGAEFGAPRMMGTSHAERKVFHVPLPSWNSRVDLSFQEPYNGLITVNVGRDRSRVRYWDTTGRMREAYTVEHPRDENFFWRLNQQTQALGKSAMCCRLDALGKLAQVVNDASVKSTALDAECGQFPAEGSGDTGATTGL